MATASDQPHLSCKVLNFFYEQDDSCALTVLVNGIRFHIIVDGDKLRGGKGDAAKRISTEYRTLLISMKQQESNDDAPVQNKASSQDSGFADDEVQNENNDTIILRDSDSAIDIEDDYNEKRNNRPSAMLEPDESAERRLYNWILSAFGQVFQEKAPTPKQPRDVSVQTWYDCKTYYYDLLVQKGELHATEKQETAELKKRMDEIVPRLPMPKYIRQLGIPWYKARDVTVLSESEEPEPCHPAIVDAGGKTFFLKMVSPEEPQPVKREIKILQQLHSKHLDEQFNVPKVEGLVGFGNSHTEIMGFLLTNINSPTPLTKLLDEEVPQAKRDKWAKEVDRIKEILHEHEIVWGDAKADNFMVDKNDEIWIIDFGGSYTDGWVDPELMETEEGDDMGVDRIINALHNPEAATYDPTAETNNEDETSGHVQPSSKKRKASDCADGDAIDQSQSKKTKQ